MAGATQSAGDLSAVERSILSLLPQGQRLYGLQLVAQSNGEIKKGSVYAFLQRLETRGLVSSRKSKSRRLYQITKSGEKALQAALEPSQGPPAMKTPKDWEREAKRQRKRLKALTEAVSSYLEQTDQLLTSPKPPEALGERIAKLMNVLEESNRTARGSLRLRGRAHDSKSWCEGSNPSALAGLPSG